MHNSMEEQKPTLSKITYSFYQEGNTDGTTDETEELIVEVEGVFDVIEEGGYMVMRTPTGWSINNKEELNYIFDIISKTLK